jgi:hypothetical protein
MANIVSRRRSVKYDEPLNKPVSDSDCTWLVYLKVPSSGRHEPYYLFLNRDEASEYNADPDLFAAKQFGFASADEYREWVEVGGAALCSERTRSGKLCRNSIEMTRRPKEWRERHRSAPCWSHAAKVRS